MASRAFNQGYWLGMGALPVHFGVCLDKKSFLAALKGLKFSDELDGVRASDSWTKKGGASCWQFQQESGSALVIVTMDLMEHKHRPVSELAGMAAHECMHAWQFFLAELGEKVAGHEMEAYHMQHMVGFVVQCMIDRKRGKK